MLKYISESNANIGKLSCCHKNRILFYNRFCLFLRDFEL